MAGPLPDLRSGTARQQALLLGQHSQEPLPLLPLRPFRQRIGPLDPTLGTTFLPSYAWALRKTQHPASYARESATAKQTLTDHPSRNFTLRYSAKLVRAQTAIHTLI